MADEITYRPLPADPCLTQDQLFGYLDGRLSPVEMHAVEKHLLDCPFCSDALEGLEKVSDRNRVVAFVPPAESKAAPSETKEGKVIPLFKRRNTILAIAASVVLLVGIFTIMNITLGDGNLDKKTGFASREPSAEMKMDSVAAPGYTSTDDKIAAARDEENESSGKNVISPKALAQEKQEVPAEDNLQQKVVDDNRGDADVSLAPPAVADQSKEETMQADEQLQEQKSIAYNSTDKKQDEAANKKKNSAKDFFNRAESQSRFTLPSTSGNAPATLSSSSGAPQGGSAQADDVPAQQAPAVTGAADTTTLYPAKPTEEQLSISYATGEKLLASGQAAASLKFFDEVLREPTAKNFEDAQWKKALALIQLNRKAEARTLLNQIVSKNGKYKTQAEEKLKTL